MSHLDRETAAYLFLYLFEHFACPRRYMQDFASKSASSRGGDVQQCRKDPYRNRGLMPGLFVMHCPCCARCIGFHVMPTAESPQALFEVLYTRWYATDYTPTPCVE